MRSEEWAVKLIRQRFAALEAREFSALYASYHPLAPFVEQFPDEKSYLDFACQALARMTLLGSYIGEVRTAAEGVEVICALHFALDGEAQSLFELALLLPTADGWRYHSGQKLTAEDYPGQAEDLTFDHFDQQQPKIRF